MTYNFHAANDAILYGNETASYLLELHRLVVFMWNIASIKNMQEPIYHQCVLVLPMHTCIYLTGFGIKKTVKIVKRSNLDENE